MSKKTEGVFLRVPAIRVEQPLGVFYATAIRARDLLTVCYSDRLRAVEEGDTYSLRGSQRLLIEDRLKEIGRYIGTTEAAFPNSVILAANYEEEERLLVSDPARKWGIEFDSVRGNFVELIIPTNERLAAIIDGQHRLFGFTRARTQRLDMFILCSVFLDLPRPYQAYLFATVNSTQKRVDRSQTYELFGYNLDEEPPDFWSPEKLAVFLTRKMNTDSDSPLFQRILVAAENDFAFSRVQARAEERWMVSTATVVDGITRLISTAPKRDADELLTGGKHKRSKLLKANRNDKSPLRALYINTLDRVLHRAVCNFFLALLDNCETQISSRSFLTKTVGFQALFDTLRKLAPEALMEKNFSRDWFGLKLRKLSGTDFSHPAFQQASGQGRIMIRRVIFHLLGLGPRLSPADQSIIAGVIQEARLRID